MSTLRTVALFAALVAANAQAQNFPFPQHPRYAAGSIKPNNRTQAQLDQDVRAAYDAWKAAYLRTAGTVGGNTLWRVVCNTDGNGNTVSEGQGYGILIVSLMAGHDPDARAIVDGLWRYFDAHRSGGDNRLMSWNINANGQIQSGNDSAFDGDNDIALGLLIAARQWSGGTIDYRAKAVDVIAGQAASVMGATSHLPLLGDWSEQNGAQYNQYTVRTSDFTPSHFLSFYAATGAPIWQQAIVATSHVIDHVQTTYALTPQNVQTGLVPDFVVRESAGSTELKPASPNFLEGDHDGHYNYNAGRVPWRLATHALLHADIASARQARRLSTWMASSTGGVATNIRPGYRLDGTPLATDYFSTFFAAPIGVAAMVTPSQQTWLNAVYDSVRTRREGYYEDSVALLSMMVMSGTFWDPVAIDRIFADPLETL